MLLSDIGAIASIITAVTAIITATVAIITLFPLAKSLLQADRNLRFSIYTEVFEMVEQHREEYEELDALIFSKKGFNIMEDISEDERKKFYKLARLYDRWGQFVIDGLLPIDFILDYYSRPLMQTWEAMGPYIEIQRRTRNQPGHMAKFHFLADEAKKYRENRYPGSYEFQKPKRLSVSNLWIQFKDKLRR